MTSRLIAVTVFVGLCALATTAVLQAHAKVEKSEPKGGATVVSPAAIQIWFNEAVDPKVSKIVLTGPTGAVKLGPTRSMAPTSIAAVVTGALADGAYSVDWQTAGDDGHTVKGALTFTVKGK